ncbi:MAG TPA: 50S ribosomal protein L4 [Planctomycetota bacterium]|nr:50S ribosomal protein L4 [Planctomycetota bacterium]
MELPVYNEAGEVTGKVEFDPAVLGDKVKRRLLHQAVVMFEARQRAGTVKTKTRAERAGSGKKPWRQKGTGRARAGAKRSPLWRKGGIIWGPKPRDFSYSMPVKARREALRSALLAKFLDKEVKVIDKLDFDAPKTKRIAAMLEKLGVNSKCLVAVKNHNANVWKSIRNIERASLSPVSDLNAYEVLRSGQLIFTRDALQSLPEAVRK